MGFFLAKFVAHERNCQSGDPTYPPYTINLIVSSVAATNFPAALVLWWRHSYFVPSSIYWRELLSAATRVFARSVAANQSQCATLMSLMFKPF
jgi:hypothetical protein